MDVNTVVQTLTAVVGLVSAVWLTTRTILRHLSNRDDQIEARQVFDDVVESLSSESEVRRLGAAILMRRFFDPHTELGQGGTPYAAEARMVMAAVLRRVGTGEFQKLLADGLAEAATDERLDLQRTNLQYAYLGIRHKGTEHEKVPHLVRADFYRADLSHASLKEADLRKAVFYQARMHNTILRNANLTGANFFEADLRGADFEGALLSGAKFEGARHLPPALVEWAKGGEYDSEERFAHGAQAQRSEGQEVFLSRPGILNSTQREFVSRLSAFLADEALDIFTVPRERYPPSGAVSTVCDAVSRCSGAIILGFRQLEIETGVWRRDTEEASKVEGIAVTNSWSHLEAGMAAMTGMPILVLAEVGVTGGLFEKESNHQGVLALDLSRPEFDYDEVRISIAAWAHEVRTYSRNQG